MSDIILELSLRRSTGVLAGVVASLAQAGIELRTQKLQRAAGGAGGWLTITGEGNAPAPSILAQRLGSTGGVDRLVRMSVDGELVLAEGRPIEDQIQPDDLAELSAGSEALAVDPVPFADENHFSEPESTIGTATDDFGAMQPDADRNEDDHALAAAMNTDDDAVGNETPLTEFAAEPSAEDDLAEALASDDSGRSADLELIASENAAGEGDDRAGALLRRRRRRRR